MAKLIDTTDPTTQSIRDRLAETSNNEEVYQIASSRLRELRRHILGIIDTVKWRLSNDLTDQAEVIAAAQCRSDASLVKSTLESFTADQISAAEEAFQSLRGLSLGDAEYAIDYLYTASTALSNVNPDGSDVEVIVNAIDAQIRRPVKW